MSGSADWKGIEEQIAGVVNFGRRPVAVAFLDAAPAGVARFDGTEPSSCSFWRLAAAGRIFYTVPENHFNCAVGAYTHNIALSPEREKVAVAPDCSIRGSAKSPRTVAALAFCIASA